jgi:hypothetical protein
MGLCNLRNELSLQQMHVESVGDLLHADDTMTDRSNANRGQLHTA